MSVGSSSHSPPLPFGALVSTLPLATLVALVGWRRAFGGVGLVTLAGAVLCLLALRDRPEGVPEPGGLVADTGAHLHVHNRAHLAHQPHRGHRSVDASFNGDGYRPPETPADSLGWKTGGREGGVPVAQELNILALIKGDERYVYVYDDGSRAALLAAFEAQAADPALSLNWFDASVLAEKAREQGAAERPAPAPAPRF